MINQFPSSVLRRAVARRSSKSDTPIVQRAKRARSERHLAWHQAFGDRLRETRLALDITEAEAADACCITLRTHRRREAGLPFRGWYLGLVSFVSKYDLSYNWLIAGAGPIFNSQMRRAKPRLIPVPNDQDIDRHAESRCCCRPMSDA